MPNFSNVLCRFDYMTFLFNCHFSGHGLHSHNYFTGVRKWISPAYRRRDGG